MLAFCKIYHSHMVASCRRPRVTLLKHLFLTALTALRLLSSEIPNETKHTAPEINVQADGEWTQAKSSKRVKQSTSSLSSNKICDQADENHERSSSCLSSNN